MKCCICGKEFKEYGNNADPVCFNGFCCDDCNINVVIPARIAKVTKKQLSQYEKTKAKVYATGNKWAIENFHATHD